MDLLTYPKKFLLIFLIFFIPLIAALSVMTINSTDEIETLHSERTGRELLPPLITLTGCLKWGLLG
jgi:hypothetical protein